MYCIVINTVSFTKIEFYWNWGLFLQIWNCFSFRKCFVCKNGIWECYHPSRLLKNKRRCHKSIYRPIGTKLNKMTIKSVTECEFFLTLYTTISVNPKVSPKFLVEGQRDTWLFQIIYDYYHFFCHRNWRKIGWPRQMNKFCNLAKRSLSFSFHLLGDDAKHSGQEVFRLVSFFFDHEHHNNFEFF